MAGRVARTARAGQQRAVADEGELALDLELELDVVGLVHAPHAPAAEQPKEDAKGDIDAIYEQGRDALFQGNYKKAIEYWDKYLDIRDDYAQAWKHLVETFGEAGSYRPEIPLFIEYKPSETRGRCFVDTASKALCLLNDIGNPDMGVTLDFGHSMYGNENPAEALVMLAESPYPYYIHINDNDGRWDWDYFCGTKHFLEYVEFLYYLKKYGYDDYLTSDTSPTRWDIKGTFEANARVTNRIWDKLAARGYGASDKAGPRDSINHYLALPRNQRLLFDRFWDAFDLKQGRDGAAMRWSQLNPFPDEAEKIIAAGKAR